MSTDSNNLGTFSSVAAVWEAYPSGGIEGNYVYIGTSNDDSENTRYNWNVVKRQWLNAAGIPETSAREMLEADGDVFIQNNLTVAGTLRANRIKQPCLGLFASSDALDARWPDPEVGMWALVGNEFPADVYRCETAGTWAQVPDATAGPDEVDLTDYVPKSDIVDNLTTSNSTKVLSSKQGNELALRNVRAHTFGGYVDPTASDSYDVGTKLCVRLEDGENTFSYFKTDPNVALKINSFGESVVELLKVNENDWRVLRRVAQIKDGKVINEDVGVIGAYTGGVKGKTKLGIENDCEAYTIVIKFRTPKEWPTASKYLVYSNVIKLALYGSSDSQYANRHTIIVGSGSIGGNSNNFIETSSLELDTDYTVIVTWDDGDVSLNLNGTVYEATEKTLAGSEGYFYVGSAQDAGNIVSPFPGLIQSVKVYTAVVTDTQELMSSYSDNEDLVLNLQPALVTEYYWLDLSSEMNYFTPRSQDGKISVVLETKEEEETVIVEDMQRVNLFDPSNVYAETMMDTGYGQLGTVGGWDPAVRDEYAAVAAIPAKGGKYYCIINPYMNPYANNIANLRVGVISRAKKEAGASSWNWGNPNAKNIYYAGSKYIIAQAVYTSNNNTSNTSINNGLDTIIFQLYRTNNRVPYPIETPLVEVYEMDTLSEAIAYVNARFDEKVEIAEEVNIDNKIIGSDHVGTLTSLFKGKSMLVLGDSLSANRGWSNYVANRFKWKGINNIAIGGANIVGSYNVTSGSQRNLIYQIKNSANMLADVCYAEGEEISGVYTKKFDTVFIAMGYNDAANGYTPGTLASVKDTTWSNLAPADNDSIFSSIAAAIKYCLFYLKTTVITGTLTKTVITGFANNTVTTSTETVNVAVDCRNAKIIWQTPIGTNVTFSAGNADAAQTDARLKAVEDVITEVCEYYSVPVVNGRKLCGISREEEDLYEGGKYLADKTHPNGEGTKKLGEMNAGAILQYGV